MRYGNYGRSKTRRLKKSRVEIIPLIDVMFLLLCFFIYATMNMVTQKCIVVDLATMESAQIMDYEPQEVIGIDAEITSLSTKRAT